MFLYAQLLLLSHQTSDKSTSRGPDSYMGPTLQHSFHIKVSTQITVILSACDLVLSVVNFCFLNFNSHTYRM